VRNSEFASILEPVKPIDQTSARLSSSSTIFAGAAWRANRSTRKSSRIHCFAGFAGVPPYRRSRWHVRSDDRCRGKLCAFADRDVIIHADAGAEHDEILKCHAARYSGLRCQQTMSPDGHIVTNLDEIVDLGALADNGVAICAAIDRRAGADLHFVLNNDATELGRFRVTEAKHKAEPVLAEPGTPRG
jgi:hypothetical protein